MVPAPTTSSDRPSSVPSAFAARSAPASTIAAGFAPMAVSARARRPVRTARRTSAESSGVSAPSSSERR